MKELLLQIVKSQMFKGAMAAAFSGGLVAAGASITDPSHFNIFEQEAAMHLAKMFGSGAVAGILLYFKNPPQKPWDGIDRRDAKSEASDR